VTAPAVAGRGRVRGRGDGGVSVLELTIAMTLFVTLTAIFLAGVVQMSRATVSTQNTEETALAARKVYTRLDQQVRSASAVNSPVLVGGSWYLEFRTSAVPAGQSIRCTQWKADPANGTLSFRTFPDTATPGNPAWTPVASTLSWTAGDPAPLRLLPATGKFDRQRLVVDLTFRRGTTRAASLETVLVARNTDRTTPTNILDASGASTAPVCQQAGRP
jgi:hypothetical protein